MSRKIAEHMYLAACQASMDIARKRKKHVQDYRRIVKKAEEERTAEERELMQDIMSKHVIHPDELEKLPMALAGAYSSFVGSPASHGTLQFDMWGVEPSPELAEEWSTVKEDIKKHGLRNSLLMAMMPTASTSQIMGNNECIEPFTNNIYKRQTLAGNFTIINKYLVADLMSLGLWNQDMKDKIILQNGSVQGIPEVPDHIKKLYKTVWEIKQKAIVDHARARSPFICQTQSMNLFFEDLSYSKINTCHFYSWKSGLKTGMYYLRSKAKTQAQKFSVDASKIVSNTAAVAASATKYEEEGCLNCSA
jgi:ribonucleoside-diphosphate reductase alpha chain